MNLKPSVKAEAILPDEGRMLLKLVGRALREARTNRRDSRQQFASRLLIGEATIKRMEGGDPRVSMGYYLAASLQLGVPMLAQQVDPMNIPLAVVRSPAPRAKREKKEPF